MGKSSENCGLVKGYKTKVEMELNQICKDILDLLEGTLIKDDLESEPKVFYQKMKADYYRYLAEFAEGEIKTEHSSAAEESYTQATESAGSLAPTHPIRL